ncbi:MAG TPA: hemolysin III family protein [Leptospiraceae bacterium]|nr:hemolysin III family protein [Leptospiraceae bacterium]HMY30262.1 hemolysin III family protein [Leptospiraceae bacterium]HMZ67629.1 hemolysin III family protein [Leptospiraceae bacterium]HNA07159.1 hemolysin III family protein [Leptospiraceae bacterium]HNC00482.1 hemolysin III family protein [Leptospiraceae bacterium]
MTKEEKINVYTHGIGALMSFIGACILLYFALSTKDIWKIIGAFVYSGSLVILFTISSIYHYKEGKQKFLFQKLDHIAIFYLIAGTYTPFILVNFREGMGPIILSIVWVLAVIGTILKIFFTGKFDFLSTMVYLIAGWTVLLDIRNLISTLHPTGLFWLAAGGLLYTGGVFFYLKESIPRNHEIWHGFVLGGAGCHYISVLFYVI